MFGKLVKTSYLLMLSTIILTACGGAKTSTKGNESNVMTDKTATGDPVELNLFELNDETLQDMLIKRFPQYHFNFLKGNLKQTVTDGTTLDIVLQSYGAFPAPGFALSLGLQFDMTDLLKKKNFDLSRFEPSAVQGMKEFGGLYGIPFTTSVLVVNYNKDLFDKFGVPYPRDGMTWDEIGELSKKMTRQDGGVQYLGFVPMDIGHLFNSNQLSIPYVDPKSGKSSIGTAEWSEKWKSLFQNYILNFYKQDAYQGYIKDTTNKDFSGNNFFEKDKVAAMVLNFANVNNKTLNEINWDMVTAPTLKDMPNIGFQPYPNYLCITSASTHKDAGMDIIQFLTSEEVQMQYSKTGNITTLRSDTVKKAYGTDSPNIAKNLQAVFNKNFAPMPKGTMYDQTVQRAMISTLVPVLTGRVDINTAFQQAAELSDKSIEDIKSQGISQ